MVPKNNRALRLHLGHNGTDFSCFPPDRSFKLPAHRFSSTTIGGAKTTKNNYPPHTTDEKSLSRAFVYSIGSLSLTHTHTHERNSAHSGIRHSLYHYILSLFLSHTPAHYFSLSRSRANSRCIYIEESSRRNPSSHYFAEKIDTVYYNNIRG